MSLCKLPIESNSGVTQKCHSPPGVLGYLFHDRVRIYGYGFQQFFAFSGFIGIVFCKNSFIDELFGISGFMGMSFRKFSRCLGILLRNFSRFMGSTFTI